MTKKPDRPPKPWEIDRTLKSDSKALRLAEEWVRRQIWNLDAKETRWLYDRLLTARDSMLANIGSVWGSELTIGQRQALIGQIEAEMERLLPEVAQHLLATEQQAAKIGYYGRAWALDMATNPDVPVRVPLLPVEAIRAMVLTPYLGQQWGEGLTLSRDEFVLRIKRQLITALANGEGIQKAQQRLNAELGVKPGTKQFKAFSYRTALIARTEIIRSSNLGALSIYEANQDILSGWEWVAARDERTCPRCGALDGKRFAFNDYRMAPPSGSHLGCRCTAVPVLIDTALMDKVAGVRQTYKEWAAERGLSENTSGIAA